MGSLIIPPSGLIYVDANPIIYITQKHPIYAPLLQPLWQAAKKGNITIVSSDLALMETLILPIRMGDTVLVNDYERLFKQQLVRLLPITQDNLRVAARLRATIQALRTPDAIHAATALLSGCVFFVTNDTGFKRVPGLPLAILDEVLAAP